MQPHIPALSARPVGGLVVAPAKKASLLQDLCLTVISVMRFLTPLSFFPLSSCNSLAFRSPVLLRLILNLGTYGGADPLGVFPLFLKMVADIIAPKLSIIFCRLIRLRLFPECWRSANVTAIPKSASSPDMENYGPISITPIRLRCMRSYFSQALQFFREIRFF